MFRLTMFPAADGDCLLLSYGHARPYRHILVDGGRLNTYDHLKPVLQDIASAGESIELLVLSHIDADHIEGFLTLAEDPELPVEVDAIWYNGFDQMSQLETMGPDQGDRFSASVRKRKWTDRWNAHFGGKAVQMVDGVPRSIPLPSGLVITLLSPDTDHLVEMRKEWDRWRTAEAAKKTELERKQATAPSGLEQYGRKPMPAVLDVEKLAGMPSTIDDEPPNGSSIAFVAEWDGKRVLLAADAHPDVLAHSLAQLAEGPDSRYRVDLYKVSHHGSQANTSEDLIRLLDCQEFAISTNGSRHGHPDPEAIARLLKCTPDGDKVLHFNYRFERTTPWQNGKLMSEYDYICCFPDQTPGYKVIDIPSLPPY